MVPKGGVFSIRSDGVELSGYMARAAGVPAPIQRAGVPARQRTADLRPGDVMVIPGGTEHEAWFREDTEVIDFFAPPRDDFLVGGKPAYMSDG